MATPSQAIARPDLGIMMSEFDLAASRRGFIGLRVFPKLDVAEQSGTFGRLPLEELLKTRNTNRAPGAGYARQDSKFVDDSYATRENGAEEPLDDREVKMYRYRIDSEAVAVQRATDVINRNHEIRVAAKVYNATTYNTGNGRATNVSTVWSNKASAVPIDNIKTAITAIYDTTGQTPNVLVINWQQFQWISDSAQVLDRIKYSGKDDPKSVTANAIAAMVGIERVLVAGGQYNSATQPGALSLTKIWSNSYAWVGRVAETDDVREPCVGRTFHYTGDGSEIDGRVEEYRDETVRSTIIRARHDTDEKSILPEAGHLLTGIAA